MCIRDSQDRMGEVDRLSHASSIAELVRNVNKALNADDPAYYAIPSTREAVAQELLLFTMQGGSGLDSMVSYDFQKALVSARAANVPTSELGGIIDKVEIIAGEEFEGTGINTRVVGLPKVMLRMMDKFMDDQTKSLILSAVGVWGVISVISGSAIIGLLCLIPVSYTHLFRPDPGCGFAVIAGGIQIVGLWDSKRGFDPIPAAHRCGLYRTAQILR